jgi:transposase-like protein/plasmid stabilization system protein ParE
MDPQTAFCPNPDCPARGQTGKDNIRVHSRQERRYQCTACGKTFAARRGTAFYRLRTAEETVTLVLTLLAHGCPLQAIVVAFSLDERTVQAWQTRAGTHCQQVQAHLVEQPRDLGQVQADELWVKLQGLKVWMAMALQVSTRLWLGGVISRHRDMALIVSLVQKIRACALPRPLLVCIDGLAAYVRAIRTVFRDPVATGRRGRPQLRPWRGLSIAQVVKQYARRRVVAVSPRIVQGRRAAIERLLVCTQGGGKINTAYIERLNATFRSRLSRLARRGRGLARQIPTMEHAMYLVGTVYNFCTVHQSLRVRRRGRPDRTGRRWHLHTPAMAAAITDHCWSVHELLAFHVPLPQWAPPKRRGRVSKATQALVARWCL